MFMASLVLLPGFLLGLLFLAAYLENTVVSPGDRANAIKNLLTSAPPDECERIAAQLFRSCDPPRRVARKL